MSWLDSLFGRQFINGVEQALGGGLNWRSPLSAELNPSTGLIDVGVGDGSLAPVKLAPEAEGFGVAFTMRVGFTAVGGAAAPDDVEVTDAAPFALRILDVTLIVSTEIGGETVTLRDAAAGAGNALSSVLSAASQGRVRNNDTATRTVAVGTPIYARRSNHGLAGEIVITAVAL
jgi:hypothetical protein